jgi:hypothetical protein
VVHVATALSSTLGDHAAWVAPARRSGPGRKCDLVLVTKAATRVVAMIMRSPIAILVALSLCPTLAAADPFATRRPVGAPPPEAAPAESVVVERTYEVPSTERTAAKIFGVTGLVLGVSAFALGLHEKGRYEDAVDRGDYAAANDARDVLRYAGTGIAAAGLVSLSVSAYFYLTAPESRTIVAPVASHDQVGVTLARSF